ncbi:MAG: 2-oxoacid:acceptor oxidoreductase family protein [Candidatus Thermoplasmatota archaeon]|nr:2-oxoacid:acceptor oxidoreductase family protein [Candidatus Thermoplasmatota archaeon]
MKEDLFTFLVGGKAGEGVKKSASVVADMLLSMGRNLFVMDDYQNLISGGHNFSVVSSSLDEIHSQYKHYDIAVLLDQRSVDLHENEGKLMVYNSDTAKSEKGIGLPMSSEASRYSKPQLMLGLAGVATFAAYTDCTKEELVETVRKEYKKGTEENVEYAAAIYEKAVKALKEKRKLKKGSSHGKLLTGNEAIALGAYAGGLDIYFAYPMTPSSSLMHFLASHQKEFGITVVHPESEIAVINMAIGAASMGARAMVGSSGGGFALMQEGLSLAGMAEVPVFCLLSMRAGPSTGVPTYTEQGDLYFALHQGHGEFARIVAAPASQKEAFYLSSELLSLAWRYQCVSIILSDKHLSESGMSASLKPEDAEWAREKLFDGEGYRRYLFTDDGISPLLYPPSGEMIKWTSYEHDENGIATEDAGMIAKMHEKRERKREKISNELREMKSVNVYGEGPAIFTYGSTTMSVLEALSYGDIKAKVIQPIYLEPFPSWAIDEKEGMVIEMSCEGQFERLLGENGISVKGRIRKYDGRPFDPEELAGRIREVL